MSVLSMVQKTLLCFFLRHGSHKRGDVFGFHSQIVSTQICHCQLDSILLWQSPQPPGGEFDIDSTVIPKVMLVAHNTVSQSCFFVPQLRWTFTLKTLSRFWRTFSVTLMESLQLKVEKMCGPKRRGGQEGEQMTATEETEKNVCPAPTVTWTRPGPWWGHCDCCETVVSTGPVS